MVINLIIITFSAFFQGCGGIAHRYKTPSLHVETLLAIKLTHFTRRMGCDAWVDEAAHVMPRIADIRQTIRPTTMPGIRK
ncbi:MAG: hypothetical protein V4724_06750 [Pseudomonadota bacterium]